MTSRNDITGDALKTKTTTDAYRDGWDRIFGKKTEVVPVPEDLVKKIEILIKDVEIDLSEPLDPKNE